MVEPQNENVPEVVDNCDELKKALAEEKSKSEANFSRLQRLQADFLNYKRFAEQDKTENLKYANVGMLFSLLPILDDLERALAAVPPEVAGQKWVEGLRLIERKFKDNLEKLGVTCIKTLGEPFDCLVMEAVTVMPGEKDTVVQELEKGYKLLDKVIRPAKVVVGSGKEPVVRPEELPGPGQDGN